MLRAVLPPAGPEDRGRWIDAKRRDGGGVAAGGMLALSEVSNAVSNTPALNSESASTAFQ
jgi:hypothetical protein